MKNMNPRTDLASNQATSLLFASLYMNMGDVLQATQTLSHRPELSEQIRETLHKMMIEELPKLKGEMTHEELKAAAKQRVEEWTKSIGTPSIDQYAALSKYWGVPISDVIKEKITPKVIFELLNCFVVGQDDYKRKLATSFYLYLMKKNDRIGNMDLLSSLLVCGPSGSGKTYGIQVLARHFGVPAIIVHCNTLVQEGIVGSNISAYFTGAWLASKGKSEEEKKTELRRAIVCFDEFDKLYGKSYYGDAIENEILSLIDDDGEMRFRVGYHHSNDYVSIPTKEMMFVFTGVFEGIDKIRSGECVGFRNAAANPSKPLSSSDFLKYGVKREIVGRIRNYTTVNPLSVEELYGLLNSKMGSPLNDFRNYFHSNGIEVVMKEDAMMALAQKAFEKELGARGLKSLLNTIFSEEMFNLSKSCLEIDRHFIEQHIN